MPDSTAIDVVTKTEAAQVYRRSERSISRDITNALKLGDRRVLQHVELRLEDGTRRPGTDLSIQEIVELRDKGLNPTWLLQTAWLKKHYGRRDEPRPAASGLITPVVTEEPRTSLPPLPDDMEQRVAVLAAQNDALRQSNVDLRTQAERLEKELDRRAEERREENELQKQNNVLMQQVYTMLSTMQESAGQVMVLPAPRPNANARTYEPDNVDVTTVTSGKGTRVPNIQPSTNNARGTRSKKRSRARQAPSTSHAEPKPDATTMSKYLPTLDRAVRSLFRR